MLTEDSTLLYGKDDSQLLSVRSLNNSTKTILIEDENEVLPNSESDDRKKNVAGYN